MLEELLKYDRLGSKDELLFLLFKALPLSKSQKISDLKKYCISNHFSIGRSFEGALKLLEFMAFIDVSDGVISINDELFDPAKVEQQEAYITQGEFIANVFLSLKREDSISNFIKPDALRRDAARNLFYVKDNFIPFQFFSIRNLLISVGFFGRDPTLGSSNLFVNANSTELFETLVVNSLREEIRHRKRRKSLSEPKVLRDSQEVVGREAEIFVLGFEQQRLQGHPSIDGIQRVSEDDVTAGFDIESFNDKESVFVDRFIEVKSYSENAIFYWAQNEIRTAKELAEKYFLYLVDCNKMSQLDYTPRIFQNPYQKIFKNDLWEKEPEIWRLSAPKVGELEQQSAIVLDNESKERALVGEVISTVALAAQLCREFNVSDHGIDMEIEFKSDAGEATGRKLYLQLKSGASYLRKRRSDGAEIFTIKDERHARYWMAQAFPVLLVIRNSEGEVRWMEVRDWLKRASDNGKKSVKQIVFEGERFDVMSVRRWRDEALDQSLP